MTDKINAEVDDSAENMVQALRATFADEAYELLAEFEGALLGLEKDPADREPISRAFRALHTIKGSGGACGFREIASFTRQLETIFDRIRSGRLKATPEIISLALQACDQIRDMFNAYYRGGAADAAKPAEIVALLRNATSGMEESRPAPAASHAAAGEAPSQPKADRMQLRPDTEAPAEREQQRGAEAVSSIRVATGKLDSLVNLVGELVTVQARLTQTALTGGAPALLSIAEEVERLTASLRDTAMHIRMLPIGTTFGKFTRLVRDLSAELGKETELITDGAETELDKTVIERLSDPLVHIIRNCIDHGIEPPSARAAAGKPKKGSIHLSAVHSGVHVLIRVRDDGAGLDADAIRARAVEKGIIPSGPALTEQELQELILSPGFSTAKTVTGVSGRGVGMDVVKRAVDALRGTIEISSARGRGTTITLKLPLTLAIIDGFLTRIGGEHFIFPLALVQECIEPAANDTNRSGRNLVNLRGRPVPYIRLRDLFCLDGDRPAFEQIVLVNVDGLSVGLAVDTVVGEHQTVLKSLGRYYRGVEGISGATILGDGTVALILDIPKLVRVAEQQEVHMTREGALLR